METIGLTKFLPLIGHMMEDKKKSTRKLTSTKSIHVPVVDKTKNQQLPVLQPILRFDNGTQPLPSVPIQSEQDQMAVVTSDRSNRCRQDPKVKPIENQTIGSLLWAVCCKMEKNPKNRRKRFKQMKLAINLNTALEHGAEPLMEFIRKLFSKTSIPTAVSPLGQLTWPDDTFSEKFEDITIIDRGAFGIVMKARHKLDRCEYAVKRIEISRGQTKRILREVHTLANLSQSETIVGYRTAWIQTDRPQAKNDSPGTVHNDPHETSTEFLPAQPSSSRSKRSMIRKFFHRGKSSSFSSLPVENSPRPLSSLDIKKQSLFIQMELCGKSLKSYLIERNSSGNLVVEWLNELWIFEQMLEGVHFIHDHGFLHRDLKPANILFSSDGKRVKIADFGLARILQSNSNGEPIYLSPGVGTESYAAPEVRGQSYGRRADIYSLGIILFELLYPMSTQQERSLCFQDLKKKGQPKLPADFALKINPSPLYHNRLSSLILNMTQHAPKYRPESVEPIIKHLAELKEQAEKNQEQEHTDRLIEQLEQELRKLKSRKHL